MHEPNRKQAQALVMKMMAIPGQWGRETQIAAFIIEQLRAAAVPASSIKRDKAHTESPFGGECGNIIVTLPGSTGRTREPRRMLSAHMDTVPICVGCKPVRRGNRIVSADRNTGLGGDDRAGSAVILTALTTLLKYKLPHPPLTFLWCVQEEVGLIGARHVDVKLLKSPRLGFNFDGGKPAELVIGATGAYRMNIDIRGVASHAGVHPERGVSATVIAARAIADLDAGGWHGLVRKGRHRGTSNVGVIEGGAATNVVTDHLRLRAEARAHDRAFRKRIVAAYRKAFASAARHVRNDAGRRGSVKISVQHDYEAFALRPTAPVVLAAAEAARAAGLKATYRIANGGLDANYLNAHGIATVTLGAGQKDIHTTKESLNLPQYHAACRIALRLAGA
ncbi:MAG: M20/M25/M40 family metallo-hydrolase [Planctomycetes bacterium]|nr:M20/M25/M40 family metallo-hydrolase [Planctomycetota bacterium]